MSRCLDFMMQCGRQTAGEQKLESECVTGEWRCRVRSRSRVDVGMWLREGRVWAYVEAGQLVLLAHGKRAYCESSPLAELTESRYNHTTGELILAPAPSIRHRQLKLPPLEADAILEYIPTSNNE